MSRRINLKLVMAQSVRTLRMVLILRVKSSRPNAVRLCGKFGDLSPFVGPLKPSQKLRSHQKWPCNPNSLLGNGIKSSMQEALGVDGRIGSSLTSLCRSFLKEFQRLTCLTCVSTSLRCTAKCCAHKNITVDEIPSVIVFRLIMMTVS